MANFIESLGRGISRLGQPKSAFDMDSFLRLAQSNWDASKPKWVSLRNNSDYEKAARFNPIVNAVIGLTADFASNGRKIIRDVNTNEIIPWDDNRRAVQAAYRLFVKEPNPLQDPEEFTNQGVSLLKVFGNRYSYANVGLSSKMDLLNVQTLWNLPTQDIEVRTTGALYDQVNIEGIISKYINIGVNPIKSYDPFEIVHFNEVNYSSDMQSILGISPLEALQQPISNSQYAFEAMNTLLASGGAKGIISPSKKDSTGANLRVTPDEKKQIDERFKETYGTAAGQNLYWFAPIQMDFIRTNLSAKDLAIYEELGNNAILICNKFKTPPELVKTWIQGATYENQEQSEKRFYNGTIIPMVRREDKRWSNKLDTYRYGFYIDTDWSHVSVLQKSIRDNASANQMNSKTANTAWNDNQITRNTYLGMIGVDQLEGKEGDYYKYEWDKITGVSNNNSNIGE